MKTRYAVLLWLVSLTTIVHSQDYKINKSSGRLEVNELNNVTFEGHSGNEIIFTSRDYRRERDSRAEGLRAISSMGMEDNTGLGLSVQEKGNSIEVYQLKKMDGPKIKILVPKGVTIAYKHSSPYGSHVSFTNIEGEIEVSTVHNSVSLTNVTGPMTIKTVHGKVEAEFSNTVKSPVSMVSVHGLVDVTIPPALKANVTMTTSYGEMFVDPAIKIEMDKSDWVRYGSNKVNGKMNGGGIELNLSSSHGNIYVRKK